MAASVRWMGSVAAETAPARYAATGRALAVSGSTIVRVWRIRSLGSTDTSPLLLPLGLGTHSEAHAPSLAAVDADQQTVYIAAAIHDRLLIWYLGCVEDASASPPVPLKQADTLRIPASKSQTASLAEPQVVFSPSTRWLACWSGAAAFLVAVSEEAPPTVVKQLTGHSAAVSVCAFGGFADSMGESLICAREDRCFRLWTLSIGSDNSASIRAVVDAGLPPGGSQIVAAAIHPAARQLVLAEVSGMMHVYEVKSASADTLPGSVEATASDGGGVAAVCCRSTLSLDVDKLVGKLAAKGLAEHVSGLRAQRGSPVLSVVYCRAPSLVLGRFGSADARAGADEYCVLVCTASCSLLLRPGSWEAVAVVEAPAASPSRWFEVAAAASLAGASNPRPVSAAAESASAASAHAACDAQRRSEDSNTPSVSAPSAASALFVLRASAFEPLLHVWQLSFSAAPQSKGAAPAVKARAQWGTPLSSDATRLPVAMDALCLTKPALNSTASAGGMRDPDGDGDLSCAGGALANEECEELSIFPRRAPRKGSPLAMALQDADVPAAQKRPAGRGNGASCGSRAALSASKPSMRCAAPGRISPGAKPCADQPVTFNRRVQSSGYGSAPIMKLHAGGPSTRAGRAAARGQSARGRGAALTRRYTPAAEPPAYLQAANTAAVPFLGAAQLRIVYSGDGAKVACAGADGSVSLLRLPARKYAPTGMPALLGHTAPLTSVCFSHSNGLLLSASADGSACLWDVSNEKPAAAPLLRVKHRHRPPVFGAPVSSTAKDNPVFKSDVRQASFLYLDRFFLLATGSEVLLYSYALQRTPSHDANRAAELRHSYSLRFAWKSPGAHGVCAYANANAFLSSLLLIAPSDRSLCAFDLGSGKEVLRIEEAHDRAVSVLRVCEGSAYADAGASSRDLFLTAAPDGQLKLWDLRAAACARLFAAHSNRTHAIGACLSPCLRYVCCGSEDRTAYMYDAGSGSVIATLPGHSDTVTDVAFSPLHPQLATTSFDGKCRFFADRPDTE